MIDLTKRARGKIDGIPVLVVTIPVKRVFLFFFFEIAHEDNNPVEITN